MIGRERGCGLGAGSKPGLPLIIRLIKLHGKTTP
ncbi:hypothetical protein S7711_11611 [Stachybotrys chartarum IBT 7711]|uniref:Uncharacterized protein n=1 Tax=Stachybotrys chartarum (strain CBS 109288 / IBT 7711) TaxID=1280523 RepID=A0A084B8R8_STACB|nr:hypothetical protein S7711_11611 [Stachybotrys chartarum IBT 7711]